MPAARLGLAIASAAWTGACAVVAGSDLAPHPEYFWAGLPVSLGLVATNLAAATARDSGRAARVGHVAIALGMYAVLFPTAHVLLGPGHFATPPNAGALPWVAFSLSHLLRAADAFDIVRDWGAIQTVRHTSTEAAWLLVGFHLVAGLFVVDAIGRVATRVRQHLFGDMLRTVSLVLLSTFAWLGLAACAAAPLGLILAAQSYPAGRGLDWQLALVFVTAAGVCFGLIRFAARLRERYGTPPPGQGSAFGELGADAAKPLARVGAVILAPAAVALVVALVSIAGVTAEEIGATGLAWWALDQVIRGADFADAMQLFGLRLHNGPDLGASAVLGMCIRIVGSASAGIAVHWLWRCLATPPPADSQR